MRPGPTRLASLVAWLLESKSSDESSRRTRGAPGRRTLDVFRAFERIGPPLTEHAEPSSFRKGRLTLRVKSSAWLTELAMMQSQLLTRLNASLPKPFVEEVRLVLGTPRPKPDPKRARPQAVLGPGDAERVAAWASELSDDRLREAFIRAASRSLAAGSKHALPFRGPAGPRVVALSASTEVDGEEDEAPELTYGYGDRTIDKWKLDRRKSE